MSLGKAKETDRFCGLDLILKDNTVCKISLEPTDGFSSDFY